jgi:predicted MFS family arabinose efflux permease
MHTAAGSSPTRTIVFLAIACFASAVSLRAADPILPEIAKSFGTTPGVAAQIVTFFGLAYGAAQFGYGLAGERFGKLKTMIVAAFLSAATAWVCAFATSLSFLVVARVGAGIAAAAIIPLAMAWIGDAVPYERRQSVLARFLSGQISGLVLGQAFGGIIAEHLGWRWVFVMLAVLFFVSGCALAYEFFSGKRAEVTHLTREPMLSRLRAMLGRGWVLTVLIAVFFEAMIFFGAFTFLGSDLWARFGIGFDAIGLIVAGFGVGGLVYAGSASFMLPRLREGGLVIGGGIVVALAFGLIALAPAPWLVAPATIAAGFGYYMLHNTLQTNATQMAPEARGIALGIFASSLFLGQSLGVAIAAPIFDYTGGAPIFLAAAIFLLILAVAYRARARRHATSVGA